MYYTYSIKNLENGKFYIGSRTSKVMLHRKPEDDLGVEYFSSTTDEELKQAIKDGKVKYTVIQEYDDPNVCWKAEQKLISLYWKFFGKEMSYNHSCINCKGVSIFSTNGKHHSNETIKKMKINRKGKTAGENNPMFGKHRSAETKRKISEKNKGKKPRLGANLTDETKRKIGEANKGKLAGENHPMFGKHLSEETKNKLRTPKQKFYWLTPDGETRVMDKANANRFHKDWVLIEIRA